MPRKLPWQVAASSSTTARLKRPAGAPTIKRQKIQKPGSDSEREGSMTSSKKGSARDRARLPTSSPPPEPPTESFMKEGKDNDDRYRMVEDEFLAVAQQFTVHLHAAEYKKQQKAVKNENAQTINSISRPVTGKMPEQTKRNLEAAALAKRQRAMVEGLTGKKEKRESSEDSDIEELPYVGTTLHGLMDSPRKKAASLAKLGSVATTRAAAGFKQSAVLSNSDQHKSLIDSPKPKHTLRHAQADLATDDDDDLDAPILPPKLTALDRKSMMPSQMHTTISKQMTIKKEALDTSPHTSEMKPVIKVEAPSTIISTVTTATSTATEVAPKLSRLERIRLARAKKEREQQIKKEEDYITIPTF